MQGLNDRQEAFCQLVVGGMAASSAYQKVYGGNQRSAESNASRLLRNDKALQRIAALRREVQTRAGITLAYMTQRFFEDADLARALAQPGAATAAHSAVAKMHGLMTEKHLHEHVVRIPSAEPSGPDELTEAEWGSRYGITYEGEYLDVTPKPEPEPQTIVGNTNTQPIDAQTILEGSEPHKEYNPDEKT